MDATAAPYSPDEIRELFHRKALAASRHRAAVAKQIGLAETEAEALAHLARAGGITPSQLSEMLGMTSGGVTALVQRLERADRVSRRPHPRDKRSSIIEATPAVVDEVKRHYERLTVEADRITARLSDDELETVGRYLERIVMISERRADEAVAALRAADEEDEPREPVELWA
ncbi:MAG: MarR family winged helix-turn-helix transcriptional regulator [Thermoleophilaceae bacterium]